MDPVSIAASCVGIAAGIATLIERLTVFVSSVREARKDLDAVRRELGSLQLSLSALSDEDTIFGFDRTPLLKENLLGVLGNCGGIVGEISKLLEGMEGDGDGKMAMGKKLKWATTGKGEMRKLRIGLEAHKSALDIALDLIAISITADIKQDTTDLKEDTGKIKEDTDQILQEIGNLQIQVAQMDVSHDRGYMMKRFLESSITYAESVANLEEFEDLDAFEKPSQVPSKVPEDRYSRKEDTLWQSQPSPANIRMAQPNLSYIDQSGGHGSEQSNSSNSYWSKLPQRDRDSLFLLAATHGNLKRMALLLSSGANIDAQNVEGKTPICVIIEQNHPSHDSCLQFLLDNGASIDDNDEGHGNLGGNTNAFSLAYNLGNQRAMEIIMASHPENTIFKPFYDFFLEDSSVKKEIFIQHAVALANFEPRNEYEIALREGTAVSEVRVINEGLAFGWSNAQFGRFPPNLVKSIHPNMHKDLLLAETKTLLPVWRNWTSRSAQTNQYAKFVNTSRPTDQTHRLVRLQISDTLTDCYQVYWFCYADLLEIERRTGISLKDEVAKAKKAMEDAFDFTFPKSNLMVDGHTKSGASLAALQALYDKLWAGKKKSEVLERSMDMPHRGKQDPTSAAIQTLYNDLKKGGWLR